MSERPVQTKIWVYMDAAHYCAIGFKQPEWWTETAPYQFVSGDKITLCSRGTLVFRGLIGLRRLPPRNEAWQIDITKPGACKVLKKIKGGSC